MDNLEFGEMMRAKTKALAIDTIKLAETFPNTHVFWVIGKQLLKAATSVAANYRSTMRGRSDAEFYSKLNIVVEECEGVLFWLEILEEAELIPGDKLLNLKTDALSILKILATSKKNMKSKLHPKN